MKIVHYCQHVLGIGHLFRSLELARALHRHDVIMVTGGPDAGVELPSHVRHFKLPSLEMDENFNNLGTSDPEHDLGETKEARKKTLFELFERERPDLFLVELYPFGRKKFRFELAPVLQAARNGALGPLKIVCSLRDILVERTDRKKFEERVVSTLNAHFDALLIHSDPGLQRINESFQRTEDIHIPVHYTGYVSPAPQPNAREKIRAELRLGKNERLIIASAGGGKVGGPLIRALLDAWPHFSGQTDLHLRIYTGPYLSSRDYKQFQHAAEKMERISLKRFSSRFLDMLAAADLSISMGGYNTTMNVLAAELPALVWPFGANLEQITRAQKIAKIWPLRVLRDEDLAQSSLTGLMTEMLTAPRPRKVPLNLNGARHSATLIEELQGLR